MRPGALHQTGTINPDTVTSPARNKPKQMHGGDNGKDRNRDRSKRFHHSPGLARGQSFIEFARLALCDPDVRCGSKT